MATGTAPSTPSSPGSPTRQSADTQRLIEQRLEQTRRQVKWVDLATALVALTAGVLAYLLVAAVLDHWVIPGGFGRGGRIVMWLVLMVGAGWYFVRSVLPVLLYPINPVFAAYTIEQARPSFKNSLINLLFLRRQKSEIERDDLARRVYEGLETRTARDLAQVAPESAVDRSGVIRLGYVLVLLVALCCLYLVLSPKNPLVSFERVVWPWADVQAPTRVQFRNIEPRDATAYQGDTLVVSAEVRGLRSGEEVTLYYTTADGQSVNEAIPMTVPEGGYRYQCELPPGKLGFQQSVDYRLAAGDGAAGPFHVDVQTPLTILVDRVQYDYPAYTGLAPRTVEHEGDLRAVEGTRATVHAAANQPIQRATMELNCDSRYPRPMTASGQTAEVGLLLRMSREDPTQPEYNTYHLRFTDSQNRENRRPIRHRIEVIPDLKPDVRILNPPPEEVQLPLGGQLDLKIRAEDPDFGLRRVGVRAQRDGKSLDLKPILEKIKPEKAHQGPFEGTYRFKPAELKLKAGDRIQYWAEALDNKEDQSGPAPNQSETEKRWVVIVPEDAQHRQPQNAQGQQKPDDRKKDGQGEKSEKPQQDGQGQQGENQGQDGQGEKQQPSKEQPKGGKPQDQKEESGEQQGDPQNQDGNQGESKGGQGGASKQKGGKPNQGQSSPDQNQGGQGEEKGQEEGQKAEGGTDSGQQKTSKSGAQSGSQDQQPRRSVDGGAEPGKAMQEILKDREQRQKQEQQKNESGKGAAEDNRQEGSQQQPGAEQQPQGAENQGAERQPDGKQQGERKQPGEGSQAKPDQRKQGKPPGAGEKSKGQQEPGEESAGADEKQGGQDQRGSSKKSTGKRPPGGQEQPGNEGGEDQEGQKEPGKAKSAGAKGSKGQPDAAQKSDQGEPSEDQEKSAEGADKAGAKDPRGKGTGKEQAGKGQSGKQEAGKEEGGKKEGGKGEAGKENAGKEPGTEEQSQEPGKSGMKQGDPQRNPDNPQGGKTAESEEKPEKGKGAKSQGPGDRKQEKQPGAGQERPEAKGGNPEESQSSPGEGQKGTDDKGGPSPQAGNQPRKMTPKEPDANAGKSKEPQSPSNSEKQSKSKGQQGDKSGGGGQGGGQEAGQQGTGHPGSKSSAEEGAGKSEEQGDGETGSKAGEQAKSDKATGKSGPKEKGEGAGKSQPGGKASEPQPGGKEKSPASGQEGKPDQPPGGDSQGKESGKSGSAVAGNPERGGKPGDLRPPETPPEPAHLGGEDPNLAYSKQQTTLALRHLQEEMGKDKSELLDRLGWSKQDAEKFLSQWQEMMKSAKDAGPRGQAAKQELDAALKSLGLRPGTTSLKSKQGNADALQNLRDPGRFPPPPKWRDQFRAYTEGVGSRRE